MEVVAYIAVVAITACVCIACFLIGARVMYSKHETKDPLAGFVKQDVPPFLEYLKDDDVPAYYD